MSLAAREYFNPRSPCGERRGCSVYRSLIHEFQPTLPMRGATEAMCLDCAHFLISTHAPHAGSDIMQCT